MPDLYEVNCHPPTKSYFDFRHQFDDVLAVA